MESVLDIKEETSRTNNNDKERLLSTFYGPCHLSPHIQVALQVKQLLLEVKYLLRVSGIVGRDLGPSSPHWYS